jgi:hypothetical protein
MKNKKLCFIKAIFLFVIIFLFSSISHAYSVDTHALLTKETAEFLDSNYSNEIPNDLVRYLIDGSRREDDVPRWINHFYDPIYNRGLSYDPAIDPKFIILQTIGNQPSFKDWALNANFQETFLYRISAKIAPITVASILTAQESEKIKNIKDDADFSWDKALKLYIQGDKEGAMFALGHVIHLIQDASIPDHTRNDPHADDSFYEDHSAIFNSDSPDNDLKLRLSNETPESLLYLDDAFNLIAEYSNKNFYSKDTIGIQSGYAFPTPLYFGRIGNDNYGLLERDKYGDFPIIRNIGLLNIDGNLLNNKVVQSAYWTRLSTKSVIYGASVIDLFFREAERLKDDEEFKKEGKNFIGKIVEAFLNMFDSSDDNLIAEIPVDNSKKEEQKQDLKPFVYVDKTSVYPGETIIESGSQFTPNSEIILYFSLPSGKIAKATSSSNENGQFNHVYTIHPSAETGVHYYWAEDKTTGFITDKIKYLIVSSSDKKPSLEKTEETPRNEESNDKKENKDPSLSLPKECSFSNSGEASGDKRVVINEIAWMGSTESSNGEWIELKNVSSSEINISGWWLIDQAEQIKVVFPGNALIPAGRFYLLERGDDDALPDVKADLVYTGTLSNTKEGLKLFNPDCLVEDKIIANPNWPAGNSANRRTMERKNNLSDWQTSSFIDGTPKQENSDGIVVQKDVKTQEFIPSGGSSAPSYCSQNNLTAATGEIILNEIAWAGDTESSSNEWIEFYNPSGEEKSISGWQLLDKAENIKIIFPSGAKIPAKGYYLAMRGSEAFIPGVTADISYTGSINNSDEELRLFNGGCVLADEVTNTGSNWKNIGGSAAPDYKTAERLRDGSWHSFSGPVGLIMGTPKAENSPKQVGADSGKSDDNNDDDDDNEDDGSNSSWGSLAVSIVVSEIMPGEAGNPNGEFIELYNPTGQDISLDGWYLAKKSTPTSEAINLISEGSGLFNGKTIPAKSFLLIASQTYSGDKTPDIIYSQASSHLANNEDIIVFYTSQDEPILVVTYEAIETGKSWERKAYIEGVCIKADGEYEFSGNGCNADDQVVWNIRDNPAPQNLASLPEPRDKPAWPFSSSLISVSYNAEKIAADITWPPFTGRLRISDDNGELWSGSGVEGGQEIKLYELGKEYKLYFEIIDDDGLSSADKPIFYITAPRLITDFNLYKSSKYDFDGEDKERNILEFSWTQYPFVPKNAGGLNNIDNYKILVLYKNMNVPDDVYLDNDEPLSQYADNIVDVCYENENGFYGCRNSFIFSDVDGINWMDSGPNGDQIKMSSYFSESGNHKSLSVPVKDIEPTDFITIGYYAMAHSYVYGCSYPTCSQVFTLVAKDNTPIMLGDALTHSSPSAPSEFTISEFESEGKNYFQCFWIHSVDIDTPYRLMRYEISHDNGNTWELLGSNIVNIVNTGEAQEELIRAVDDFGLRSPSAVIPLPLPDSEPKSEI